MSPFGDKIHVGIFPTSIDAPTHARYAECSTRSVGGFFHLVSGLFHGVAGGFGGLFGGILGVLDSLVDVLARLLCRYQVRRPRGKEGVPVAVSARENPYRPLIKSASGSRLG